MEKESALVFKVSMVLFLSQEGISCSRIQTYRTRPGYNDLLYYVCVFFFFGDFKDAEILLF